ncbi:hypothetical protein PCANC_05381 [Puccinia coronata f. sp. avenae]|uniref:Uncharacterized protein n=1 Tax=Puccinia coronata f. sp. avenae TaxID=200324 RepID=A0A2N5S700_9BASI|nr:hypothetical protein PCASD_24190 [Puccinia coronata f. sp. avenae]PLW54665.1 hypothetical protein PCANC_05381 [Puccinia coronata f. sp. avenae]
MSSDDNNNNKSSQSLADSHSTRRGSFLSSLFSIPSPTTSFPRHNSLSSASGCSTTTSSSGISPSYSSLPTTHRDQHGTLSGSPASSSFASPIDSKFSSNDSHSPHSRQASLSDSFSGLASSFRWPGSSPSSNVQPISIPNADPSSQTNHHHHHHGHHHPTTTPTPMVGTSAPTRRTSVGGTAFRRAFELPTYTNAYDPPDAAAPHDSPADPTRRGRSGSLFSSFGIATAGDASKRTTGPPRRKLSPMGERMIRDHPF